MSDAVPRVGFVIGGVQKGGTTALARYLAEVEGIALPKSKEAHIFDAPDFDEQWTVAEIDRRYAAHFDADDADHAANPASEILHGDATPIYVFHPRLIARIARYNPRMRWLILLRDPVERAYSHYQMERGRGAERWPAWAAFLFERWRLRGHHDDFSADSPLRRYSYRARGDYARQLDALYRHFPAEQVLLLQNARLNAEPAAVLNDVCAFLGLPGATLPAEYPRVFEGGYRPLREQPVLQAMLRWLLRRQRRAARLDDRLNRD